MVNSVKVISLFVFLLLGSYNRMYAKVDSLGIFVSLGMRSDTIECKVSTGNPKHHLSLLMQGLHISIAGKNDTVLIMFPDARLVRDKVKRHPNEVKPVFNKDSIGREVRPDLHPLLSALKDTTVYIRCLSEYHIRNYDIFIDKVKELLTFVVKFQCIELKDEDVVDVIVKSRPEVQSRNEFVGRHLSKDAKRNPQGLGEKPASHNDKNRIIDYTTKVVIIRE